jgi:hypothetical protein
MAGAMMPGSEKFSTIGHGAQSDAYERFPEFFYGDVVKLEAFPIQQRLHICKALMPCALPAASRIATKCQCCPFAAD